MEAYLPYYSTPVYTSSTAPAATAVRTGTVVRMSDVGATAVGSYWVSDGTSWQPYGNSPIVLARSSVQVTDTSSSNDIVYAKVTLPAIITSANRHYRIRSAWTCTNPANTKTYRAHISTTSYAIGATVASSTIMAAMTGQTTTTTHAFGAVISNRNATNAQAGFFIEARNQGSISVGAATASIDTTAAATYLYISALKATGSDTMTLEDYVVECF